MTNKNLDQMLKNESLSDNLILLDFWGGLTLLSQVIPSLHELSQKGFGLNLEYNTRLGALARITGKW